MSTENMIHKEIEQLNGNLDHMFNIYSRLVESNKELSELTEEKNEKLYNMTKAMSIFIVESKKIVERMLEKISERKNDK